MRQPTKSLIVSKCQDVRKAMFKKCLDWRELNWFIFNILVLFLPRQTFFSPKHLHENLIRKEKKQSRSKLLSANLKNTQPASFVHIVSLRAVHSFFHKLTYITKNNEFSHGIEKLNHSSAWKNFSCVTEDKETFLCFQSRFSKSNRLKSIFLVNQSVHISLFQRFNEISLRWRAKQLLSSVDAAIFLYFYVMSCWNGIMTCKYPLKAELWRRHFKTKKTFNASERSLKKTFPVPIYSAAQTRQINKVFM